MAFSMFVRNTGCASKMFAQQIMRTSSYSQKALIRPVIVPQIRSLLLKDIQTTTPILNAMRNFKTTAVSMSATVTKDHSKLWLVERVISVALVPLFPLAIMFPNKLFDSLLAITIMAHTFWGFEAIVHDYLRPIVVGSVVSNVAIALVYILCAASLGGLFYVIQHDVGIGNTIRKFWSIGSNEDQPQK